MVCKNNKASRELYERIINQGKSKKLALIVVYHKLLKQAFAIGKSEIAYNENLISKYVLTV
jgi:transposase